MNYNRNIRLIFFITFLSFNYNSFSQDGEKEYEDDEYYFEMTLSDLLDIKVSSSSKFAQKTSEAPSVISVITKDQIRNNGWISLEDIMNKQPGFGPAQDYDRKTVSTRGYFEGWNNNHFLLLVDGIPMNDNLYGTAYTWENTALNTINSLELIRGPGSALYGSNAMNGVLQINTPSAADIKGSGEAQIRVGENGLVTYDFLTGAENDKAGLVVGINSFQINSNDFNSYDGSGRMNGIGELQKYEVNDQKSSQYMWAKIEAKGKLKGLSAHYHWQNWNFNTGHGWLWQIPDLNESMKESRHIIALKFNKNISNNLNLEVLSRYQRHNIDWNMRFYPNNSFGYDDGFGNTVYFYPAGMYEYLNTKGNDVFTRLQLTYKTDNEMTLLFGVENTEFFYKGDSEHYTNINIYDDVNFYPPFDADNRNYPIGDWFEFVTDKLVNTIALFGQYTSGSLLGENLIMTLGARYDNQFFKYNDVYDSGTEKDKSFSRFTPRAGLVFKATDNLAIKALWGIAFRTPSPTEMFGANTWTLASNIDELEPEQSTTAELAVDWSINENINWRTNFFHTEFENQIAYSTANANLSTNVYTGTNAGAETELLYQFGGISGFLNYSLVMRLDETIIDNTIATSDDLVWEPAGKLNFALNYSTNQFKIGMLGHYHAAVERRISDKASQELPLGVGVTLDMDQYRDQTLEGWFTLDFNASYTFSKSFTIGTTIRNAFDSEYFLIKNGGFPFDYQQEGRRAMLYARVKF